MYPRLIAGLSLGLFPCVHSPAAFAQAPQQGMLELLWGDAAPGDVRRAPKFEVNLVDSAGRRQALDPQPSLEAAGDLFSLAGRPVAMTLQLAPWPNGKMAPEVLVEAAVDGGDRPAAPAISGAQPWVTILCKFSDIAAEPKNLAYFGTMLSNQNGRLDNYWREVSYNKASVAGSTAYGWFTLPSPRSTYITTDASNHQTADLTKLFNDCTGVANATVDFSPFVGVNTMYNGDLDGYAWGGNRYAALDGPSRNWYVTWEPPWGYANEAPLAHEMGHGFGLPHANNSDLDSDPYDNPWDVMSDAWDNAGSDATYGAQPKHINVWSRDHLGWIDAARKRVISTDGTTSGIVLDRASLIGSTHTQMIVVSLPAPEPASHYYVIEARKRSGYYEANLAGDAVIIHEVNTTRQEPAWSVDASVPPANVSNNAGSMFVVGESWTAPGNALRVSVTGATTDGFLIDVVRGNAPADQIFKNGFD
jgi:M6 family metalloprotease-like protein